MQKDTYIKLRQNIKNTTLPRQVNFHTLYKELEGRELGLEFKQFCELIKSMGVYSYSKRIEGKVYRYTGYDKSRDQVALKVFTFLDKCTKCDGTGLVKKVL